VILGAALYQASGDRDGLQGGGDLLVLIREAAGLLAIYAGLILASPYLLDAPTSNRRSGRGARSGEILSG
jgi:hypothetical protein